MDKTSNPSLSEKTLNRFGSDSRALTNDQVMTTAGVINKTGILFVLACLTGAYGWNYTLNTASGSSLMIASIVVGMILAFTLIFVPRLAPVLAPLYAIVEGFGLGAISGLYEIRFPGIVTNALISTVGILFLMLTCYRVGILRATPRFTKVVIFATGGLAICYLADIVLGFAGTQMPFIHEGSTGGMIFSAVAVVVASLNLILDFDQTERGVERRLPKSAEWFFGFSLMLTMVWLYLELLRMLSKRR